MQKIEIGDNRIDLYVQDEAIGERIQDENPLIPMEIIVSNDQEQERCESRSTIMSVQKTLQPPTEEEKEKVIYENSDICIYPHALTEEVISCPQHAVFRVEIKGGGSAYMAISSNKHVCAFDADWQVVFDDFLAFARANAYKSRDIILGAFFKNASGNYMKSSMMSQFDLWPFTIDIK